MWNKCAKNGKQERMKSMKHVFISWRGHEKSRKKWYIMEDEGTGRPEISCFTSHKLNRVDPILLVLGSSLCLICRSQTWLDRRPSYDLGFLCSTTRDSCFAST